MNYFVSDVGAIVRVRPESVEVEARGWGATFVGVLANDVVALARGEVSNRLRALCERDASVARVMSWATIPWRQMNALDAVRLDGFNTLFLELVGTCNERCVHCYAESGPQVRAALDRSVCEAIIDDAVEAGFARIQFTGGDPLLCRFLPELVERASRVTSREIYTNGLLLDEKLLGRLAPHTSEFAFSFYSSDAKIHDAITRTPGSQRKTIAAIQRVVSRALPVRASVIILDENVATVDETVALLRELGVTSIAASATRAAGRGSAFAWKPKPTAEIATTTHRGNGEAGDGKLAVTYDGDVVPCIFNRDRKLGVVDSRHRLRDVLASLATSPPPAVGRRPSDETRLSCSSCRVTDRALAAFEGP